MCMALLSSFAFFFFLLAQLKVQNRGRESKPFSSYTQRDDVMCVCVFLKIKDTVCDEDNLIFDEMHYDIWWKCS